MNINGTEYVSVPCKRTQSCQGCMIPDENRAGHHGPLCDFCPGYYNILITEDQYILSQRHAV